MKSIKNNINNQKSSNHFYFKNNAVIKKYLIQCLLMMIAGYQKLVSPLLPARCRYYPTCSNYAKDALKWYGVSGIGLVARRVLSCHPWGGCGVDFVPLPLSRFCYYYTPKTQAQGFGVFLNSSDYNAYRNHFF